MDYDAMALRVRARYLVADIFKHEATMYVHLRLLAWASRNDPEVQQWIRDVKIGLGLLRCWRCA